MAISSPGIGSNLDVNSIVSQLMSIEQRPLTLLAKKEASFQAKLSGFGTLKGALSQFQTAMRGLSDSSKFQGMRVVPADTSIATASAGVSATAGVYTLEVSKLAQAQKLASAGQASSTAAIGTGATTVISFGFGTINGGSFDAASGRYTGAAYASNGATAKTVTVAGNSSLSDIRDAINKADIGVSATIVNDGGATPYRLALTVKATGEANSLNISVTGDAAISSLLSHAPDNDLGQGFTQTASAQNAAFKVDGINVTKATNTVADVIQGVTLNLLKANTGSPTNITVARDTAAVTAGVEAFVKAYNDITKIFKEATAYNPATKQAAILNGESSVRTIESQIRSVLSTPVAAGAGAFTLLSQVGVSLQKDGLMAIDSTKLQGAIDKNFSDIATLFAADGATSDTQGYAYRFDKLVDAQLGTVGTIASRTEGINASLKTLAESMTRVSDRLANTEKRYRAQFTALDVSISSMLSTGNFLTQQLANLSKNNQ
ncbi:MAG: flagellar filament capping protein FliD [Pseudomonadota bacterium]